jgi:hypothetical protein
LVDVTAFADDDPGVPVCLTGLISICLAAADPPQRTCLD